LADRKDIQNVKTCAQLSLKVLVQKRINEITRPLRFTQKIKTKMM